MIKHEKISDIWKMMTNTVHMVQKSIGQGYLSAAQNELE